MLRPLLRTLGWTLLAVVFVTAAWSVAYAADLRDVSPFEAIRWQGMTPQVRVDGAWYGVVSIDGVALEAIMAHCTEAHAGQERKRFGEDLVRLLTEMGVTPDQGVDLVLTELVPGRRIVRNDMLMTEANRAAIWRSNKAERPERMAKRRGKRPAPRKVSPFEALRWREGRPQVRLDDEWYGLAAINEVTVDAIMQHCARRHPTRERKRFGEDLVQVLTEMGQAPHDTVDLTLIDLGSGARSVREDVPMTGANRWSIWRANQEREPGAGPSA